MSHSQLSFYREEEVKNDTFLCEVLKHCLDDLYLKLAKTPIEDAGTIEVLRTYIVELKHHIAEIELDPSRGLHSLQ